MLWQRLWDLVQSLSISVNIWTSSITIACTQIRIFLYVFFHAKITCLTSFPGLFIIKVIHQLYLWPIVLSPLRHAPGPPVKDYLYGELPNIIRAEAGVLQSKWVKEYGPVVRTVGPIGMERMIFLNPEAMQKILVSDWIDYPRVCFQKL